jgi:hypothetical protein
MVYGAKAILPTDLDYGAPTVMMYKEQEANEFLEDALDQLEEAHDIALLYRPSTSRRYVGITVAASEATPSTSGIWCYTSSRATRAATSFLHYGRGHTLSPRCSS